MTYTFPKFALVSHPKNRYAYGYRDGSECAALAAYPRDAPPIQCGRISTGIVGYEVIERI